MRRGDARGFIDINTKLEHYPTHDDLLTRAKEINELYRNLRHRSLYAQGNLTRCRAARIKYKDRLNQSYESGQLNQLVRDLREAER